MTVRVLPYGERAVLVELADAAHVLGLQRALAAGAPDGVEEWVPAARTVLVRFDPGRTTAARVGAALESLPTPATHGGDGPLVTIPVVYDGADLTEVATTLGWEPDAVAARHCAPTYTVAFCGFTPGFAYLVGGDAALRPTRLPSPRPRVPAGSVAVADAYSAVYPTATPGGWRLLGRTDAALWDPAREPPALLAPGTRVRFERVRP